MAREPAADAAPVAERRARMKEIPLISIWGLILIIVLLVVQGIIFYFLFSSESGLWSRLTEKGQEEIVGRTYELDDFVLDLKPEHELGRGFRPKLNAKVFLEMSEKNFMNYRQTLDKLRPWISTQVIDYCLGRTRSQLDSLAGRREFANHMKNAINKKLRGPEEVVRDVQFQKYLFTD